MKLPLPLRIFVFHLIFMVALGAVSVFLVRKTFEDYREEWEQELQTAPAEELFAPLVSEVARSMLLRVEEGTSELQAAVRASVGESLDRVLPTLPSIESLVIVDDRQDVQYSDDPATVRMVLAGDEYAELLTTEDLVSRAVLAPTGEEVVEVLIPIYDEREDGRTRLGAALAHYTPSPLVEARLVEQLGEGVPGGPESWLNPWVGEVARYVLRETHGDPGERTASYKQRVSEGLSKIIDALPMETLVIVDQDRRIQYVNDPQYLDLEFVGPGNYELFAATDVVRRAVELPSGERGVEIMLPVFEEQRTPEGASLGRRRLGSVLVQFQPDPALLSRLPELAPSPPGLRDYLQPLSLFFVVAMGGGILLAALTGVPVRRVERALRKYRERGFKGELDEAGLPSDLAGTIKTISELGGRLEALDAKGREREAILETLSHTLEDGMLAVDPTGEPVSWNPAAMRILVGTESVPEEKAEETSELEMLRAALARNEDLRFAIERIELRLSRELELRLADGTTSIVRLTQVPIELPDGVMGTLVLLRDLAALRKVETHLLDTGRFAVLTHLGASLAHEIRNPLHAIQLNTSVVQEYANRAGRSGPVSDSLTTIREEAQRLTDLLNNYLGLVRAGDDVAPVDLRDVSKKVIGLVDYLARQSNVTIELEGEDYPPTIEGVPGRLQQAVLNLMLNAIQAMPEGGTLTVRVESSAGMVRLTVSDTGPGLPQDRADQLFDTRVTTKPEGSGLGLPLVRLIAEAHGGGVWYRSRPGEGTAFTLAFPLPVAVT